jgi:hypothetical protein
MIKGFPHCSVRSLLNTYQPPAPVKRCRDAREVPGGPSPSLIGHFPYGESTVRQVKVSILFSSRRKIPDIFVPDCDEFYIVQAGDFQYSFFKWIYSTNSSESCLNSRPQIVTLRMKNRCETGGRQNCTHDERASYYHNLGR